MRRTTLISDFDNTLYDWFDMWHSSFSAMVGKVVEISGIDAGTLYPEIRKIYQKYGTSEYAFLLEQLPSLKVAYPGQDILQVFDEAVHAYRSARKASLKLYDGVIETLTDLRRENVKIVLYTESLAFYTNYRIRRLGLDEYVDYVFSPPDHALPDDTIGSAQNEEAKLKHAKHKYLPEGVTKPNPEVLLDIVSDIGKLPSECIYLGDSLMKDVAMAQDAKITDVLAAYGKVADESKYALLQKVSHWPETDVQKEQTVKRDKKVKPSHTINSFSEIRAFFRG